MSVVKDVSQASFLPLAAVEVDLESTFHSTLEMAIDSLDV